MIENVIARRYAKALVAAAIEKNALARTREEIVSLADMIDAGSGDISVPEFTDFLRTPTITVAEKLKMTDVLCEKMHISKLVSDFLNVLIKHRRTAIIGRILRYYVVLMADFEHISEAEVESAAPLTEKQQTRLAAAIEKRMNGKIRFTYRVNPALIAGISVKIGDVLLEDSLRGRWERMRTKLI